MDNESHIGVMETTRTKVLRSTLWTTGTRALGQLTSFVSTIILAHLLAKRDFGLMSMALVYMGLLDMFIDFGFLNAIIQAKSLSSRQLSSCFWLLMTLSLCICGATYFGAPYIAKLFGEQHLTGIVATLAITLPLVPSQIIGKGILSRDLRIDVLAKIELFTGILRIAISIFLAYAGFGVWSLVYGFLIEKLSLAAALPFAAKWTPRFAYNNDEMRPLWSFGMNMTIGNLLWYVYYRSDSFIIGRFLGADVLGVYTIASQFAMAISHFLGMTLQRLIFPLFARYQDSPRLSEIFLRSNGYLIFISLPLFFGLSAITPDVVKVFLGSKWLPVIFPMQIISILAALQFLSNLHPLALNAIGRPAINLKMNLYSALTFMPAFYWGAQHWGLNGILWIWISLYPVRFLIFLVITSRIVCFPIRLYLKEVSGTLMAGTVMFMGVHAIRQIGLDWNIYVRMISCITLGAIVYLALQAFLSRRLMMEVAVLARDAVYPPRKNGAE